MLIKHFLNSQITKFILIMVLWIGIGASFYFGLMEIEIKNNLEMSLIIAAAVVWLLWHLTKILKKISADEL